MQHIVLSEILRTGVYITISILEASAVTQMLAGSKLSLQQNWLDKVDCMSVLSIHAVQNWFIWKWLGYLYIIVATSSNSCQITSLQVVANAF